MTREFQQAVRAFNQYEHRADTLWDILLGMSVVITVMAKIEVSSPWYVWIFAFVLIGTGIVYRMYYRAIKRSRKAYVELSAFRGDRSSHPFIAEFFRWKDLLLIIPPAFTGHLYFIDTAAIVGVLWLIRSEERRYLRRLVHADG